MVSARPERVGPGRIQAGMGKCRSATGTQTRVARAGDEYPNQLHYNGSACMSQVFFGSQLQCISPAMQRLFCRGAGAVDEDRIVCSDGGQSRSLQRRRQPTSNAKHPNKGPSDLQPYALQPELSRLLRLRVCAVCNRNRHGLQLLPMAAGDPWA